MRLWDQERGIERVIDFGKRHAAERFRELVSERNDALTTLFNRYGVDSIDINTETDYIRPLTLFFRSRAKRL